MVTFELILDAETTTFSYTKQNIFDINSLDHCVPKNQPPKSEPSTNVCTSPPPPPLPPHVIIAVPLSE